MGTPRWDEIHRDLFPRIPGVAFALDDNLNLPPYAWRNASPRQLALSFTYNTNAVFRILNWLQDESRIADAEVKGLLDNACLRLARIYRARAHHVIRNINNNVNMYLISKVVEQLVGRRRYDSEAQELTPTLRSLHAALAIARDHVDLPVLEKMGVAVGAGVSFVESRIRGGSINTRDITAVQERSYQYFGRRLAIDDRLELLDMVADAGRTRGAFRLAVILDDATETIDDLLWLQDLVVLFPFLVVDLLVNTAQVSINFSAHLLPAIRHWPALCDLTEREGAQFIVTPVYCPFISFQLDFLPPKARRAISTADAVYIKGANFFETCQIQDKPTFHAFVVFGPISRLLTGLEDFDAVFAYLPSGTAGYVYAGSDKPMMTLNDVVSRRMQSAQSGS
jgi:hypothetical protein